MPGRHGRVGMERARARGRPPGMAPSRGAGQTRTPAGHEPTRGRRAAALGAATDPTGAARLSPTGRGRPAEGARKGGSMRGGRLIEMRDLRAALALLTRLPVRADGAARARGARAAWAWPLAGAGVGALAGLAGWAALAAGLPAAVAAGLVLTVQVVVTGALHEDGLADVADGFWGGWTPERRLEIMRDSRIGAYGALALVLGVGLRWAALAALAPSALLFAPIAAGALSRAGMAAVMAALAPARPGGLAASVGRPSPVTAALAGALGLVVAGLAVGPPAAFLAALAVAAAAAGMAALARAKLGGQTGDVLGAAQQAGELAVLVALAAAA